jgi:hypothetical protein
MWFTKKDRQALEKVKELLSRNKEEESRYEKLFDKQQKIIDGLYEKLLAKNLPEYKTYAYPENVDKQVLYDPFMDENLAGTIQTIEEKN